ncbi:MAG: magnesium chelatase [Bacteroidota bacterium]|nr:magnesium chelatase [Bacteroidota bacterium]
MNKPKTLGELKKSGYKPSSIQNEISKNLSDKISRGQNTFEGLVGYEKTVIPDLERALLSGHSINLLGLRGQAKTRIARQITKLLDEWVPIVSGSEINDDPLNPITNFSKELIKKNGDNTQIEWMHRDNRFFEKLATPDVSIADLIGDVDPIKASNLNLSYSDERVIHFGMIPRAHRCVFVLNELPDLQARIQVALFSVIQEKEIQIRGFKLRLEIKPQFVFTSNPEDYTNRGSIVTPLKDRIGSQILTHYPYNLEDAKKITFQEAQTSNYNDIYVPELARDIIEQVSFEARKSKFVDEKSGVSARMSISAFENLISCVKRRMLINSENKSTVRLSDFLAIIPGINGKIELVYEGEQEGTEQISFYLINEAIKTLFPSYFPEIKKLQKINEPGDYDDLLEWFLNNNELFIDDELPNRIYEDTLTSVPNLEKTVNKFLPKCDTKDKCFMMEFLLWGLEANKKLSKYRTTNGFQFKNDLGNLLSSI